MLALTATVLLGYLIGSLPASLLIARRLRGVDIRQHGSGNAGASNVLRVVGWQAALAVLAIDIAKGWVASWLGSVVGDALGDAPAFALNWLPILGGVAAIVGHVAPVWIGFRGGKGVATGLGVGWYVAPWPATVALAVFVIVVLVARRISIGSMLGALTFPLALLLMVRFRWEPVLPALSFGVLLAAIVIVTHRGNIARLLAGTEPTYDARTKV